ncbi:MAG: nuclear transport factor 2 family protein [Chitinophagaceae bacterium]|nr:MAG: nuclear transport factor 2 family protein [Chitinophagaceae bacterium]
MDSYAAAKETKNKSTSVVRTFLDAVTNHDFEKARSMVADDLKFIGVKATVEGADEYFNQMKQMKLKYDIRKVFSSENDVAVFYDIKMGDETVLAAGWYGFQGDLIKTIQVVFDSAKFGA